jgi:hypothetical protein
MLDGVHTMLIIVYSIIKFNKIKDLREDGPNTRNRGSHFL